MANDSGAGAGSKFMAQDVALMRQRRREGRSFREIGSEFSCSPSVAHHYTSDVIVGQAEVPSEQSGPVLGPPDAIDRVVKFPVPLELRPETLLALSGIARLYGYSSVDELVGVLLRKYRMEPSTEAQPDIETRLKATQSSQTDSRWNRESEAESLTNLYLEGLEVRRILSNNNEDWETRRLRAFLKIVAVARKRQWSIGIFEQALLHFGWTDKEVQSHRAGALLSARLTMEDLAKIY